MVRISFYTSARGDEATRREVRRQLQGLGIGHTFVATRRKGQKSKTVDIQLATDLLVAASERQVDDIVLVSADRDFLPVVSTAKHYGVRVFLALPGLQVLEDDRLEEQDKLRKAMGLKLDANYPLAFDGILRDFEWLDFQKLDESELWSFACEVLGPAIAKGRPIQDTIVHSEQVVGYRLIEGNVSVNADGVVTWAIGRSTKRRGELSIWPTSTFAERYKASFKR